MRASRTCCEVNVVTNPRIRAARPGGSQRELPGGGAVESADRLTDRPPNSRTTSWGRPAREARTSARPRSRLLVGAAVDDEAEAELRRVQIRVTDQLSRVDESISRHSVPMDPTDRLHGPGRGGPGGIAWPRRTESELLNSIAPPLGRKPVARRRGPCQCLTTSLPPSASDVNTACPRPPSESRRRSPALGGRRFAAVRRRRRASAARTPGPLSGGARRDRTIAGVGGRPCWRSIRNPDCVWYNHALSELRLVV